MATASLESKQLVEITCFACLASACRRKGSEKRCRVPRRKAKGLPRQGSHLQVNSWRRVEVTFSAAANSVMHYVVSWSRVHVRSSPLHGIPRPNANCCRDAVDNLLNVPKVLAEVNPLNLHVVV